MKNTLIAVLMSLLTLMNCSTQDRRVASRGEGIINCWSADKRIFMTLSADRSEAVGMSDGKELQLVSQHMNGNDYVFRFKRKIEVTVVAPKFDKGIVKGVLLESKRQQWLECTSEIAEGNSW